MDKTNERTDEYRYLRHDKLFVQVHSNDEKTKKQLATVFCYSCNASRKGIKIELDIEVEAKAEIELWLSFEGMEHKFYLSGMVRWCESVGEGVYQLGVEIENSESTDYIKWMALLDSFAD